MSFSDLQKQNLTLGKSLSVPLQLWYVYFCGLSLHKALLHLCTPEESGGVSLLLLPGVPKAEGTVKNVPVLRCVHTDAHTKMEFVLSKSI